MTMVGMRVAHIAMMAASIGTLAISAAPAIAQAQTREFNIPAQPLSSAILEFSRQADILIVLPPGLAVGKRSIAVKGNLPINVAIAQLLRKTGLRAIPSPGGGYRVGPLGVETTLASEIGVAKEGNGDDVSATASSSGAIIGATVPNGAAAEIVVTGSRIRGAASASPEITLSRDDITRSGQSNLGEVIRSLPQNFNGGQNPTVTVGTGGAPDNINVGSGASLNLRGVGQDATLTLLNSHRVAYNASNQGVDISAIPLAAIDRFEIVTDGSSALYGSDAVGGVANIILRRDFDGLWTSGRFGTSTDGGDFQQQYSAVAGSRWSRGGVIATYDFGRDTPVTAGHRSYTSSINPGSVLVPYQKHHSAIISVHQDILAGLDLSVDGTFNDRWSNATSPVNKTGTFLDYGLVTNNHSTSYSVAPTLKYRFSGGWQASVLGVYGEDRTLYGSDVYLNGADISATKGCYCNTFRNAELSGEGPLFRLPGGDARLAVGGGFRENGFHAYRTLGSAQNVNVHQGVYYAYGEINLPVLSRLSIDGAARYERYSSKDQLVTPKIGLIYTVAPGLQVKGTWGKSFRAPTLYEQYAVQYASLYSAAAVGGRGYPTSSTALVLSGANPDLKSEKATSWTTTLVVAPPAWRGFHAEISYYHIDYRDRVVTPITSRAASLANAAYAELIENNPSAADVAASTSIPYSFQNLAGTPLNAANVVAIIDNRNRNVAQQVIEGVDVAARYLLNTNKAGNFTGLINFTYLDSKQRLGPGLADLAVSGVIFYPPHVRGRGGLLWDKGNVSLSSFLNYVGGVSDNRQSPVVSVGSMTTVDLSARYALEEGQGILSNSSVMLSVQNVNNAKPSIIRTTASYFPPFDSTNYSAVGRFVSFTISKKW